LQQAGILLAEPGHDSSFEDWWCEARRRINKADRRRFDTLVILAAWSIWKQRNDRVFGNSRNECNEVQLIEKVREEFRLWEFARFGERGGARRE
jgi:hypothetical protein